MDGVAPRKVRSWLAITALALCVVVWAGCGTKNDKPTTSPSATTATSTGSGSETAPSAAGTEGTPTQRDPGDIPNSDNGSGNSAPQGVPQTP